MNSLGSICSHLYIIDKGFNSSVLDSKKGSQCDWCSVEAQSLWLCLYSGCLKVGCGSAHEDHSTQHNALHPSHCIAVNLDNLRAYCYMCEIEVTSMLSMSLYEQQHKQQHLGNVINTCNVSVATPATPNDSSNDEVDEEEKMEEDQQEDIKPRGLVGLCNLGHTCYMNAALQALSNSIPLTNFFLDCPSFLKTDRKQVGIIRPFHRLLLDMWHQKRPSCVAPTTFYFTFKTLYPMFRPYTQQDSQEFLRYFMDQLHEELRRPFVAIDEEGGKSDSQESELETEEISSSIGNLSDRARDEDTSLSPPSSHTSSPPSPSPSFSPSPSDHEFETCGESSDASADVLQRGKSKRRKRGRNSVGDSKGNSMDGYFSDAMSESALLPRNGDCGTDSGKRVYKRRLQGVQRPLSSATSGLGSSKPSLSSIASSLNLASAPNLHEGVSHTSSGISLLTSNKCSSNNIKPASPSHSLYQKALLHHQNAIGPPKSLSQYRKKKTIQYRSVVSDTFDGGLVSSVQCLTCNTVSSTRETFQDLSLPIPSSDQLNVLQSASNQHSTQQHLSSQHSTQHQGSNTSASNSLQMVNSCDVTTEGWSWVWWVWMWLRSWVWGPSVSLHHCLAAFFSADELKGDNMYSCEKCGKLRNGVKFSKLVQLPEVLIVHLKRFRHEYMFSSKLSQYVSFPLHGLDLSPFLHKDCISEVRTYDLYSLICHHGAVGSGHYTAYSQNIFNSRWYEYDDQCVTEVSTETVSNCEAYVLFYKKNCSRATDRRERTVELMKVSSREPSLLQFYVSKQWINKFNTFAEPGPIDNSDFLCPHGGVQPSKTEYVSDLVMLLSQGVWEYIHKCFGGGPACSRLYECITCREEMEALIQRQEMELRTFVSLNDTFQMEDAQPSVVYAISMRWFRSWEAFVRKKADDPPSAVDNSNIALPKKNIPGCFTIKPGSDYAQISKEMWTFFHRTYGGGPELFIRYGTVHESPTYNHDSATDTCAPPVLQGVIETGSIVKEGKMMAHASGSEKTSMSSYRNEETRINHPAIVREVMGMKSLSSDDIHYKVSNSNYLCVRTLRQRTVSAGEVPSLPPKLKI